MNVLRKVYKPDIKSIDDKKFSVEAIISTSAIDRDNEIVEPSAFLTRLKNYKKHPVLLSSHKYFELQAQIGEAEQIKVIDDGLYAKFNYYVGEGNAEADWAFNLVKHNIAAYSVGFIPFAKREPTENERKQGVRLVHTDVELAETSQVVVPSNRDALVITAEKGNEIEREFANLTIKTFFDEKKTFFQQKPEPEVTENYIRIRIRNPDLFIEDSFRTIDISVEDGIKAVVGKLKNPPEGQANSLVVQSYLFDKNKWTVQEAQRWVQEHKRNITAFTTLVLETTLFDKAFCNLIERNKNFIFNFQSYIDSVLAAAGKTLKPQKPKAESFDVEQLRSVVKMVLQEMVKKDK